MACPRIRQPAGWPGKEPQHLCRHTCAPAALHLDPGCLQAFRVGLRNYFYTSVRACNTQGIICIIPPSRPKLSTNTSASWNFFFLSLHHSISRSRMLFNHQVSPFATCGSKPFLGSAAKRNRWCGRLFVLSSSFVTCTFALRSLGAVRGAAAGLVFSWQGQADCHSPP